MTDPAAAGSYPWSQTIGDLAVTFRLLTAADRDPLLTFTRGLPEADLLFLPIDISRPEVIDSWIRDIESGRTVTVVAEESGQIIGYCSLLRSEILWTRHLGEIHLVVGSSFRGKGVGGHLARQVFALAKETDLFKLVVNMLSSQRNAQNLFHHLGFIPEAMLHDWAIDRNHRTHALIIMSREVEAAEP